jgi:hypothetical protein
MSSRIVVSGEAPPWGHQMGDQLNRAFASRIAPTFSKTSLPPAVPAGQIIYVPDETGGAVIAFSDGAAWRRVTDRNVVS